MRPKHTPALAFIVLGIVLIAGYIVFCSQPSAAQTASAIDTSFTYQGRLSAASGEAVNGDCALRFTLYPSLTEGSKLGSISLADVPIHNGQFTALLDFGPNAFISSPRFLEIEVDCNGNGYVTLSPRQQITAVPYAIRSIEADNAKTLKGYAIADQAPAVGQALIWEGARWSPAPVVTFAGSGSSQSVAHSDHTHDARYQRSYKRTIIVSPDGDGADAAANGLALRTALAGISHASESNPYLLVLEPGIYDVGSTPLQMTEYVDVLGSGRGVTVIRGGGSNTKPGTTVLGVDHAELRQLTIEADGHNTLKFATAIFNDSVAPILTDIDVYATGGTQSITGIHNKNSLAELDRVAIRIHSSGSSDSAALHIEGGPCGPLRNVSIFSQGGNVNRGVLIMDADPTLLDFQIEVGDAAQSQGIAIQNSDGYNAGGGVSKKTSIVDSQIDAAGDGLALTKASAALFNASISAGATGISASAAGSGAGVTIDHCVIHGTTHSLYGASGYSFKIGATKLDGPRDTTAASAKCSIVYDGDYFDLGVGC